MGLQRDADKNLQVFIEKIRKERNLDLNTYESSFLKRRIWAAMLDKNIGTYEDYADLLDREPKEYGWLFAYLYINKTEFFRDRELWEYLRHELLPEYFAKIEKGKENNRAIKIWSVGCASGEEAYSIAILIWDLLGQSAPKWDIQIFAIDMNEKAITNAQRAVYGKEQMMNISYNHYSYFHPQGPDQYCVDEKIKSLVWFQKADIMTMLQPVDNDFIFCRNILIYFKREIQEKLKKEFLKNLRTGGHLILGGAELMLDNSEGRFRRCSDALKVYQKK